MPDNAQLIHELKVAQAVFQLRAIQAVIGIHPLAWPQVPGTYAVARPAPVTNGGAGQSGLVPPHTSFDTVRGSQDHV